MISKVFIKRPVTAMVISILLLIIGGISIYTLPISQYPNIAPPTVTVSSTYTGADAQTVEQTVTTPIESQINGTPGMIYMQSNSTSDGGSRITVTFEVGTDIDIATLDVQNRVGIAEPALPEAVRRLGVTTRKANSDILMMVSLVSPNGTRDAKFLSNYANLYLKDALMRVKGVGDVMSFGQPFSMRVWLDANKLANLGLSPADVTAAIQEQNSRMPGGSVGGRPQETAQVFEYPVITDSDLSSVEDFENIIVKTGTDGSIVLLKDVARVELGQFNYSTATKVNGMESTGMMISQTPGGNAVETADGIYKALDQLKKAFPKDVDYVVGYETVSVVHASIDSVIHTLVEALILVTLVVFIFLQNWRATLIPVLAIPVSIVGTFIFFNLFGFSINNLTMLAFVLAIGIVVDDAIVVVEAVQHYIDSYKMSAKEATERAMKDITAPVIAIALILAAVFVPVGFIPGMVGQLYQQFAITIAVSVMLSAFIALSLTPALCSLLLKPTAVTKESTGLNKLFYKFNVWFAKVTNNYSNGVKRSIKKAPLVLIILLCIFVGTGYMFKVKPTGFIPTEDGGIFMVGINLPEASSSSRSDAVLEEITKDLRKSYPEIEYVTTISGMNILNRSAKPNGASLFVSLKKWKDREKTAAQIVGEIMGKYRGYEKASVIAVTPPAIPGLGFSGGFSMQIQDQASVDIKEFEAVTGKFLAAANQRPEIAMAYTLFNTNSPNYKLKVDREQAKRMGVPVSSIYSVISSYLGSSYINDFTKYGRNFRVVSQADTSYRMQIEDIGKLYVKNVKGASVPLGSLVSYELVRNPSIVNHFNIFRAIEVSGQAAPGYSSGDALKALEEVAAQVLPTGYSYDFSGVSLQEKQSGNMTIMIFSLCIIFVFLLLASLYESWSVPFSILLSVPLGVFGAILTLILIPRIDNNIFAQIGLVTIIGLAAKNAILIVEFAKERVDIGMPLYEATLEAVKLRLRPIIMTSFAFILGIIPLMISTGAGAFARQTIGWTVFGGMTAATLLAIFIVPVLFVVITRLAYGKKKLAELEAGFDEEKAKNLSAH
ncbi:transporter, hydrophobe/amphiphile efflux-1 (HAE1) family [Pseudopedobacter saltans DSM 12145]|uniref:Transporter, hydrophobe/amphiphile efflux-1 (HAE1) family n=1 Tax=Pseudopedobacter saltans (strain ATCC 51119 / DSM 12145 / JCM 21818 / CCUG 39354 / LMG 10337 / NBRC 100064 / NCIMB 13643) TaxID=762903 RepID=F0SAS1_PSESL|nr:multidrug efflux RND transporter permease subunit [Pseudopedobacter saltans]ADY53692.1 transporter, hydrophobe/amphiphile efflux-1 (HAE1) family [Pseudopedobacter saltans DSM 12145]